MSLLTDIAARPAVQAAWRSFAQDREAILELIVAVQQIPAPTFAEAARARFVAQQFAALGLSDVQEDALHNVYGRFPGTQPHRPPVILSAHLDTVFPQETELTIRWENGRLYGPGIGDNATGVGGLIALARALRTYAIQPAADLWFVANVREEGMGDLRGMRAVVTRFGAAAHYLVIEGGLFGSVCHQGIGVRRYRIDIQAPGGHSWSNFGNPSAIHVMGRLIAAIDDLHVPQSPRTTYNVGVVQGGQSINSIAQSASLWLDMRSESVAALHTLEAQVQELMAEMQNRFTEATITPTLVGNRPAGQIPREAPLVTWAVEALHQAGQPQVEFYAGSTDANIPLSLGISSVCIGLARSQNAHRLDEYLEPKHLPDGLAQLLLLALTAAEGNRAC